MTPTEGLPLIPAGLAFLVAGSLVRFALGRNLLDVPNTRSSHDTPTPRLGGIAVILGTWLGTLFFGAGGAWPLLLAATLVGLVGLADDFNGGSGWLGREPLE